MLRATALALLALVGCSDGGTPTGPGPEPAPSGRFTADRSTYVPFRVAQLALDAPAPQPGASITGTLGGVGVDLLAAEDSVLLVAVPDLASGNHVLTFTVGSREYRGSLTITSAPALPDPVGYLDAVTEHATATIAAIRAGIDSTAGGEAMLELLSVAEDSLAAFDNARAALSAADAAIVAQVLRANYAGLEGFPTAAANTTFWMIIDAASAIAVTPTILIVTDPELDVRRLCRRRREGEVGLDAQQLGVPVPSCGEIVGVEADGGESAKHGGSFGSGGLVAEVTTSSSRG